MLFFFFEMNAFFENQVAAFLFLGNLLFRMSCSEAFFLIRMIDPLKVVFFSPRGQYWFTLSIWAIASTLVKLQTCRFTYFEAEALAYILSINLPKNPQFLRPHNGEFTGGHIIRLLICIADWYTMCLTVPPFHDPMSACIHYLICLRVRTHDQNFVPLIICNKIVTLLKINVPSCQINVPPCQMNDPPSQKKMSLTVKEMSPCQINFPRFWDRIMTLGTLICKRVTYLWPFLTMCTVP